MIIASGEYPPMIDEIDREFDVRGKPVIFCWGGIIYNPMGVVVTPELEAHEGVHSLRQGRKPGDIEAWWKEYIANPTFRLEEELPAHKAEYKKFCQSHQDRNARSRFLMTVASKLAAPLYGNLLSTRDAMRSIMTLR